MWKNCKKKNKKSQSKEILYEFNIFNPENGLRDNRNSEELKNKTLNKLIINNEKKGINKEKSENGQQGVPTDVFPKKGLPDDFHEENCWTGLFSWS